MTDNSIYRKLRRLAGTIPVLVLTLTGSALTQEPNQAREILRQAVIAAGGIEVFRNIDNFTIKTESEVQGTNVKLEIVVTETIQLPDKTKQFFELAAGTRVQVLHGDDGWKQLGSQVNDLSPLEKKGMQGGLFRDVRNLFKQFDSPDLEVSYLSQELAGGLVFDVLRIRNLAGDFFHLYINSKTFLVHKIVYQGANEVGLATLEEIFSDYRKVDGIMVPHQTTVRANGKEFINSRVLEVKFNSELDPEFFYR